MKWLAFMLCAFTCFAGEDISREDIIATMRHQIERIAEQKVALNSADAKAKALQTEIVSLADDRNTQAYRADEAENGLRLASAKLVADVKEIHRLKLYLCACAYLLAMSVCIELKIATGGWVGIAAAFLIIPGGVSAALWAVL